MRVKEAVVTATDMMRASQWDSAIAVLNDILTTKLQDPWALLLLGTCYQKKGQDGLSYALLLEAMQRKKDFFFGNGSHHPDSAGQWRSRQGGTGLGTGEAVAARSSRPAPQHFRVLSQQCNPGGSREIRATF